MQESKLINYIREIYPDGCVATLIIDKNEVFLMNTESISIKKSDEQ
jgi:hypothetical protein